MTTSISMASNALILVGDDPISALSENVAAENLYAQTYEYVLSQHPWSFALKEQLFSRLSQAPDRRTGFSYAFQKPPEMIRLWAVLPTTDYRMVGESVFSNSNEMFGRYVFKVEETHLPAHFVKCMESKLASEFSISIAEDTDKMRLYLGLYTEALGEAMAIDSQQHPYPGIRGNPIRRLRRYR